MKKKLLIALGLLLVTGLLIVSFGGTTLSASPANDKTPGDTCTITGGMLQMGGSCSADVCTTVCELLGITQDELQSLRQDGLSLAEIAAGYGVTEDELVEAIMAVKTACIQDLVADGTITQEEADIMLANMLERTCEMVNATDIGHYGGNGKQGGNKNGTGNSWGECSDGNGPGDQHQWGKKAH